MTRQGNVALAAGPCFKNQMRQLDTMAFYNEAQLNRVDLTVELNCSNQEIYGKPPPKNKLNVYFT